MAISTDNNKVLGFSDITLMTVFGNFGIRWLAIAAGFGATSFLYWIVGALVFFIPLAFICSILSRALPEEGGIYAWTKKAFGDKTSFIVAWLYWVNNIFYYPAVLIFLASSFAYAIGYPQLVNNHLYITSMVITSFWLIAFINIFGIKSSKNLVKYGGFFGTLIPAVFLIVLSILYLAIYKHSATTFNIHTIIPTNNVIHHLSTLTIIMFAMAGVEIIPTFAKSVKNPKRDLYLGLLAGAFFMIALYILGTLAISIILPASKVQQAAGLMQTFQLIDNAFHTNWLTNVLGFLLMFAELAAVSIWLLGPMIIFFKCTPSGILPTWLNKTNKYDSPQNATIFMGIIVSIIVIITNILPSVSNMYQILILMTSILYFIPYIVLCVAFVKLKNETKIKTPITYLLSGLVLLSTLLAILFSFQPPSNLKTTADIIIYESEMIFGALFILSIGFWMYKRRK